VATIDDKVVSISFESGRFEAGVNKTISSLEKLKAALHFPTAGKGLDDISKAAKGVDLSHISSGVDKIKGALESLRLIAISVMGQLAAQAVRFAGRFVKSFTLDPIKQGFAEYSTNLQAIQTILANTQAAGTNLKQVNAALAELNRYSDKTIYNFSQMAKNIGTFTAAGVDLKTSTAAIKGIANLAALSGSNSEQASTAMYQLSQAIAAGSVKLQDWNSVVNAGMGGTVFQRALAMNAEKMGTLKQGAVDLVGPMKNVTINGEAFRQSLSTPGKASWLTSKVLTQTLSQFTGDLSNAQLAAQGFNDAEIKAIQQTAKTAMHAATEVKTITQVFDVAKETIGSGWAKTFQIIFGDFTEAKKTFTALSNTINGFINTNANARNKILADWKALGGRTVLIDGIKTAFHNLGLILKPIKEAFRDIFPATTGKNLFDLTLKFKAFAEALKPSATTVDGLKRTFRGLFALLDIGKQIISGIFTVFGRLFSAISGGSGGFLQITGSIGDFLVKLDQALKKGDGLHKFFVGLGDVLAIPIKLLAVLANALGDLFGGFSSGGFSDQMSSMTKSMTPLQRVMDAISKAWDKFVSSISGANLDPAVKAIVSLIDGLGQAIGKAASSMNFEAILAVIRTGLLGGLVLLLKNFFGKGSLLDQISKGFAGGIMANISGSFRALEGTMVSMQQNVKAKTLKEIAIAIALLTASVVAISFIDPKKLNAALIGIGVMMGELLGAMAILDKISKTGGFIKLPIIAAGLVILAGAIDLLTIAVFALSRLSWSELLKGLGGVGFLLIGISSAATVLSANSGGMIRAGIGITALAIAMNLLALAVRQMAGLSMGELAKGLGGVAAGLVIIAGAMKVMPTGMALQAAAIIAIAIGLNLLAKAIAKFGSMDWGSIGKGLVATAGALVVIAGAMHIMPKGMVLQAAGLLLISVALGKIASAIQSMGKMSLAQIGKGLATLAGSLIILAVGMQAMQGSIGGAVALTVAAVGISMLAGALKTLGGMSWGSILKGLVTLAAALTVIGIAGALITPAIPSLLGLGVALTLIGAGLALAGAGIFLIASGLSALVVAAPTGVGVIVAAFVALQKGIIQNAKLLVLGLLEIVRAIANTAPQFVAAFVKILNSLVDGIIKIAPKLVPLATALIDTIVAALRANQGKIIQAGFDLIIAFLQGIRKNIPALITLIVDIIVKILNTIANSIGRIVTAGLNVMTAFIRGVLSGYGQVAVTVLKIITGFLTTIASNLGRIATAGLSVLTRFLQAIASNIGKVITAGVNMIVAIITGVGNAAPRLVTAATNAIIKFINAIAKASVKLVNAGMKAIIYFLNGVATAINAHAGEMRAAGLRVGVAIIDGMTGGLVSKAEALYGKISGIMGKAKDLMTHPWKVFSPSKVTEELGHFIMDGFVIGLDAGAEEVYKSAETVADEYLRHFNKVFKTSKYGGSETLREIGKYVTHGFAQGLIGFPEEIDKVFKELNDKLNTSMAQARKTITEEQKKLKDLRAKGQEDTTEFKKIQKVIAENELILAKSTATHKTLVSVLKNQKSELIGVAKEYQTVSEKLKAAQDSLIQLEQQREDNIKAFTDQYSKLPDIVTKDAEGNAVNALATYMEALKNQADAVAAYQSTLEQLRQLGLDDKTYQKLLTEGTADQEFASQLLAGGKTAVEGLNTLDAQLEANSKTLGEQAAKNLYDAGKQSALGLIKGLKSQKARLMKEMEDMADDIVAAFNRRLKIKSPSQVFAEIGRYAMEGLAKGFATSAQVVTGAVNDAADSALTAMKQSMRNISDLVTNELNPNPVITPILDLTQVRAQAGELGALTKVTPITAAASYGQASLISAEQQAAQVDQTAVAPGGTSVKFEQNNYSPTALTEIEIYRQTKNQLSQLKSALSLT
jgi:tape measure domain-containing protein